MGSIIEKLYDSEGVVEDKLSSADVEYQRKMKELCDAEKALIDVLGENRPLLNAYQSAEIQVSGLMCRRDFAKGYRLGARMMLDVLAEQD